MSDVGSIWMMVVGGDPHKAQESPSIQDMVVELQGHQQFWRDHHPWTAAFHSACEPIGKYCWSDETFSSWTTHGSPTVIFSRGCRGETSQLAGARALFWVTNCEQGNQKHLWVHPKTGAFSFVFVDRLLAGTSQELETSYERTVEIP